MTTLYATLLHRCGLSNRAAPAAEEIFAELSALAAPHVRYAGEG
jgi:hypothetical protein